MGIELLAWLSVNSEPTDNKGAMAKANCCARDWGYSADWRLKKEPSLNRLLIKETCGVLWLQRAAKDTHGW